MKRKERFHFIGNALFHVCLEGKKLCLGARFNTGNQAQEGRLQAQCSVK